MFKAQYFLADLRDLGKTASSIAEIIKLNMFKNPPVIMRTHGLWKPQAAASNTWGKEYSLIGNLSFRTSSNETGGVLVELIDTNRKSLPPKKMTMSESEFCSAMMLFTKNRFVRPDGGIDLEGLAKYISDLGTPGSKEIAQSILAEMHRVAVCSNNGMSNS